MFAPDGPAKQARRSSHFDPKFFRLFDRAVHYTRQLSSKKQQIKDTVGTNTHKITMSTNPTTSPPRPQKAEKQKRAAKADASESLAPTGTKATVPNATASANKHQSSSAAATSNAPSDVGQKSQKTMTRAERRELQEKQRAAKKEKEEGSKPAAGDAAGGKGKGKAGGGGSGAAKAGSSSVQASGAQTKDAGKDTSGLGSQDRDAPRGHRIFSHFGSQKVASSTGKARAGDQSIHPAIIRLGLQFSEFKIVGANARCIATLAALKNVSCNPCFWDYQLNQHFCRSFKTTLLPQTLPSQDTWRNISARKSPISSLPGLWPSRWATEFVSSRKKLVNATSIFPMRTCVDQ